MSFAPVRWACLLHGIAGTLGAFRAPPATLSREQARADLDQLQQLLETRFAYRRLKGVDDRGLLDHARRRVADGVSTTDFAIEVAQLLAQFGDGHSRVRGVGSMAAALGHLPCALIDAGGRVAAIKLDGRTCLSSGHPYLVSIDGEPLDRWLDAAAKFAPRGARQLHRRGSIEWLRYIAVMRRELGLPSADTATVALESSDGQRRVELGLRLAHGSDRQPPSPHKRTLEARVLEGDVGYLRIAEMDGEDRFLHELRRCVERLRETRGLIIDVRGNSGGSRDVLRSLLPYFMRADDAPRIANVAAYRLGPEEAPDRPDGYLADRFLYPAAWSGWSEAERRAISEFAARFKPEWAPPAGEFSDWHYFVISRASTGRVARYERPVIVLMDGDSFSATDVFCGAMKGWRSVTLMGTPSGGGSGRAKEYTLTHSGLRVLLSSMASFQPSGALYDGRGVEPDAIVEPTLSDLLGESDTLLDSARARLAVPTPADPVSDHDR